MGPRWDFKPTDLRGSRSGTYGVDVAEPPPPASPARVEPDAAPASDRVQEDGDMEAPAADDSGCLIATAAHGTELAPLVQALREYRDGTLLATGSGTAFMSAFSAACYSFSPHVADLEREHPAFRQATAALIAPILHALPVAALADPGSEASVAAHGVAALLLAMGMCAGAPAGAAAAALCWSGRGRRGAMPTASPDAPSAPHRTRRSRNTQKGAAAPPRAP